MKQTGKRLLSVLLTLVMLLGMIPGGVTIEARAPSAPLRSARRQRSSYTAA